MIIEKRNDINILFFAFRYALSRNTSAPAIVIESIKENWDSLDESDMNNIEGEIKRELRVFPDGMSSNWDTFLIWVIEKNRSRNIDYLIG